MKFASFNFLLKYNLELISIDSFHAFKTYSNMFFSDYAKQLKPIQIGCCLNLLTNIVSTLYQFLQYRLALGYCNFYTLFALKIPNQYKFTNIHVE